MTTELYKLQTKNPPKKHKNERRKLIHGKGLSEVAGPEEVKGASHATTEAMMVKNERKEAGYSDGTHMQPGYVGEGVCGREWR